MKFEMPFSGLINLPGKSLSHELDPCMLKTMHNGAHHPPMSFPIPWTDAAKTRPQSTLGPMKIHIDFHPAPSDRIGAESTMTIVGRRAIGMSSALPVPAPMGVAPRRCRTTVAILVGSAPRRALAGREDHKVDVGVIKSFCFNVCYSVSGVYEDGDDGGGYHQSVYDDDHHRGRRRQSRRQQLQRAGR